MLEALVWTVQQLLLGFIPLFVAMDSVGTLPFLLGLTKEMSPGERARLIRLAIFTGLGIGLGFLAVGQTVFALLGITSASFLVAGGVILFILAAGEILRGGGPASEPRPRRDEYMGVAPLGTPLVVGPAVLATLLVLVQRHPVVIVVVAFALNLALTWFIFTQASRIARALGQAGLLAVAKVAGLLLAAIAVDMVRRGIMAFLAS
ncbi:MAG: MarC family protein [Chloroflexi bacterium]|nr:MarC family protein [Chloroflexota bacterium]